MTARDKTNALQHRIFTVTGVSLGFDDANTLRRAEIALQRWGEAECGDGNAHCSWGVERDEQSGIPFRVTYPHSGPSRRYRIADREAGALRRVSEVCKRVGLSYFHQTDPRGCSLYVSNEPLTDTNYTRGVACCAGA